MAQAQTFYEMGSFEIYKNITYDPADIQAFATGANIVKLSKGNKQFQQERNENGDLLENAKWLPTEIRGIRVIISDTGVTYPATHPNIPVVWQFDQERLMQSTTRITPVEDGGAITYGKMVTV